jgi:D-alanyl-D-alanine carboxypeptidase
VRNTNPLLSTGGVVGVKTGWTTPAGSCLMFVAHVDDGHRTTHKVYGVVLGQPGGPRSGGAARAASGMLSAVGAALRAR